MDLPALLPEELQSFATAKNDGLLFTQLVKTPKELIEFFEVACSDETWSESHANFMKEAIQWMTEQFFQDLLLVEFAKRAVLAIREHFFVLEPMIPQNLTVMFNSTERRVNSLLWGASSSFLRDLIRQECRDKNTHTLQLDVASPQVFEHIDEYLQTGTIKDLRSQSQEELIEVLTQATEWGLTELMEQCQEQLPKYIERGNAITLLIQSHENSWQTLRNACMDFINKLQVGVRFEKIPLPHFSMEFLNFEIDAMEIFDNLRFHITHLVFSGSLTEQEGFSDVINRCPALTSLDLGHSHGFTDRLLDIPDTLHELDVSKCEWLNHKILKTFVQICPNLVSLKLASNVHLKYSDWGILKSFTRLEKLDLSGCSQITDDDFKIILHACSGVTHLSLKGCTGLGDQAFFEMGEQNLDLMDLSISKCSLTDRGLVDLATRCKHLMTLDLTRCPNLTEKGVIEAVQNAPNLKVLHLSQQLFSKDALESIEQKRPYLELVIT